MAPGQGRVHIPVILGSSALAGTEDGDSGGTVGENVEPAADNDHSVRKATQDEFGY